MPDKTQDLTKCSVCGQPATKIATIEQTQIAFCQRDFELCWNILPQLLAHLVLSVGKDK